MIAMMKNVKQTLYATTVDMGGIPVRQPFPTAHVEQLDPFLLLHHHESRIAAGTNHRHAGVSPHPHRGFSPVTFVFQGEVHHRDSRGNSSVVGAGGVQWMDAGRGIVHSERPSAGFAQAGGTQEIIQLWVNTPKTRKMDQPRYQAAQASELPLIVPHVGTGHIRLVAGQLDGLTGPVQGALPILAAMGTLQAGASHTFEVNENESTLLYLLHGQARVDGFGLVEEKNVVVFDKVGKTIAISASERTDFLLLSAAPLHEPLTMHGPFVMNTTTEVMEAMRDYRMGKMGVLIEDF